MSENVESTVRILKMFILNLSVTIYTAQYTCPVLDWSCEVTLRYHLNVYYFEARNSASFGYKTAMAISRTSP